MWLINCSVISFRVSDTIRRADVHKRLTPLFCNWIGKILHWMLLLFHTLQRSARWTGQQALSYFISHRPEGAPGNDVHPADAAPSLPHPAAGSDPTEATSPPAPAGMHFYYIDNQIIRELLLCPNIVSVHLVQKCKGRGSHQIYQLHFVSSL